MKYVWQVTFKPSGPKNSISGGILVSDFTPVASAMIFLNTPTIQLKPAHTHRCIINGSAVTHRHECSTSDYRPINGCCVELKVELIRLYLLHVSSHYLEWSDDLTACNIKGNIQSLTQRLHASLVTHPKISNAVIPVQASVQTGPHTCNILLHVLHQSVFMFLPRRANEKSFSKRGKEQATTKHVTFLKRTVTTAGMSLFSWCKPHSEHSVSSTHSLINSGLCAKPCTCSTRGPCKVMPVNGSHEAVKEADVSDSLASQRPRGVIICDSVRRRSK